MPPRLKSLELHGYKTFASRTNFEFPGIITAIVGPNGSGKSNIADSLRWVLGEQSYMLLRGRKTEDMIFSGSELRPRAGMASATITFDNSDGWLPIDFSDVSITRRAYRDGQNEYLLNGQKVRLREISELLAQSGLAERTYTIIGQGLVDAALALKPEERRRLFEEAAGIGLYRSRREEAINRLDNTRRNLDRVQDILAELEPRLQSLERQARRAQEYERIKADLRLLLRDWYGYHWHRQQQELAHAKEVLRAQENRLDQARQKQTEANQEISAFRVKMNELRQRLNGWHSETASLHQEREKLSRGLAILEERQRSLVEQRQNGENDLVRVEEELSAHQKRLESAREDRQRLQDEFLDAQNQVNHAKQTLLERQAERNQVDKDLRDARQKLVSSETRQVQLNAHQTELSSRLDQDHKSLESIEQLLSSWQAKIEKTGLRLKEAEQARKTADDDRKEKQAELVRFRQRLVEHENRLKEIGNERSRLEAEQARIRVQVDVLEQADRSYAGLGTGAKFLLQASQQGKISGGFHSLIQALVVPAELETAVGAALGEYLDLIVIDANTDPEQALTILDAGGKGRAALLPVEWLRPLDRVPPPSDPDCIGIAADMVTIPETQRTIVELLLGQVVIVRNRASARRIIKNLPATARAVTLRGEVYYGTGAVISGQENRSGAGALSRPRQKQELQTSLSSIQKKIEAVQEEQHKSGATLAGLRKDEEQLEGDIRNSSQQVEKLTEAFQQASLAAEQARREQDWQINQKNSIQKQIERTNAEMSKTLEELKTLQKQLADLREEVRRLNNQLSGMPLDELQSQLNHWTTNMAVATRALKDAEARVEDIRSALQKSGDQRQGLQNRLAEIERLSVSLEQEKVTQRDAETKISAKIEEFRVVIDPAEKELAVAEKEYEDMQAVDAAAQQGVTIAERYHTQAQLDLGRQRETIDNTRRRIEEDFGLVAFEYAPENPGQSPLPLEGMVEQLPALTQIPAELEDNISRLRGQIRRMGAINPDALSEYYSVRDRHKFLTTQVADLRKADADLQQVIVELDDLMRREFKKTFEAVAIEFKHIFTRLFAGGSAHLILSDIEHPTEAGIDIEARLPGRREQGLSLLSGGERSLTAVALIFALLKVSPTPFCVMDEVDAMLDEANVGRFRDMLKELSQTTQFIIITHNRNTVQAADVIYGVTMGRDTASQVISLRLEEVPDEMVR